MIRKLWVLFGSILTNGEGCNKYMRMKGSYDKKYILYLTIEWPATVVPFGW